MTGAPKEGAPDKGDASFLDGRESPLRLMATDPEDLKIIAALVQDAVLPASEIRWSRKARRFDMLLNRFRWEDADSAKRRGRTFERVRSMLSFADVTHVSALGVDPAARDMILSLLSLSFEPAQAAPAGRLVLTLAGDGAIALDVDCIDVLLSDVTRPYAAPSGKAPEHPE